MIRANHANMVLEYLKKRVIGNALAELDRKIALSFSNVDRDIRNLQQWIIHLNNRSELLHKSHNEHVALTRKDVQNINQWLSYLYKHNNELHKYLRELVENVMKLKDGYEKINTKIGEILEKSEKIGSSTYQVRTRYEPKYEPKSEPEPGESEQKKKSGFEQKILNQIKPIRKDYIIQQIMGLVSKGKYTTKEIERIIVDEKGLCGRTTFYSYIKELKLKKEIEYQEKGQKKVLTTSISGGKK